MKFKNTLVLLTLSVVLYSCMFTEELYVKNDGSGNYSFKMDMSEMMESMKGMSEKDSINPPKVIDTLILFNDIIAENKDSIAKLNENEQATIHSLKDLTLRMQVDEEKGKMLMDFSKDFQAISELQNMEEKIAKAQSLSDGKSDDRGVQSKSNTNYSFKGNTFKRMVTLKDLTNEELEQFNKSTKQTSSFMDGSIYKLIYHFEKDIKKVSIKNAIISNDRRTLTIEIPMDTLVNNPKLLDFKVKFK